MPSAKPTKTIFGSRLRAAREDRGWTQQQLGTAALGIKDDDINIASRISRYESGDRDPDPATVKALAKALGVPMAYFHATSDVMAELILLVSKMPQKSQKELLERLKHAAAKKPAG